MISDVLLVCVLLSVEIIRQIPCYTCRHVLRVTHSYILLRFTEPPVLDMRSVVDDSTTRSPLIFVLSPGVVSSVA